MNSPPSVRPLAAALVAWLAVATAVGAAGVVAHARPLVPLMIVGAVAAWVIAYRRAPGWRARIDRVPLPALIAVHVARVPIGLGLLLAYQRGLLPAAFAVKAGWGDVAVGLAAIVAARAARAASPPRWLAGWNLVGVLDIVVAVGTAQYLFVVEQEPLLAAAVPRLPFTLLPAFVVPLVIATHLAIAARLRRRADREHRTL
jgi:hypothetical protein